MPTYRGVLGTFEGLPSAGNADFGKGDVICATRYRRDPSSRALSQRRAFPSLSSRTPSIGRGRQQTPWMEAGDPTGPPNRTLEPLAAPWGEADDASTRNNRRPGNLSSPNPTADLAGASREDTTEP